MLVLAMEFSRSAPATRWTAARRTFSSASGRSSPILCARSSSRSSGAQDTPRRQGCRDNLAVGGTERRPASPGNGQQDCRSLKTEQWGPTRSQGPEYGAGRPCLHEGDWGAGGRRDAKRAE